MPFLYEVEFVYAGANSGFSHRLDLITEHLARSTNTTNDSWRMGNHRFGPPFIALGGVFQFEPTPPPTPGFPSGPKVLLHNPNINSTFLNPWASVMYELFGFTLGVIGRGDGRHDCNCGTYPQDTFKWSVLSLTQVP